jgi:hypothetical protein
MTWFKKRTPSDPPTSAEGGNVLRRECIACGNKANFDWAVCPKCGALAAGDPSTSAEIIEPTRAQARPVADRARFGDEPDFYRDVPAPDTSATILERTDPNIGGGARIIDRTDPNIGGGATIIERTDPNIGAATVIERPERTMMDRPTTIADNDKTVILRSDKPAPAPEPEADPHPEPDLEPVAEAPEPEPRRAPLAFIVERTGASAGTAHMLAEESYVGRSAESDVVLENNAVSKRHARIRYEHGAFVYWDLASANFSFLVGPDGERTRLLEPHTLRDGDTLDLADARITFLDIDPGDPSPVE